MAKRTIRRNPLSVNVDGVNEKYFNFAQFGGINSNKNFVGVNQYSFEDANNVYVDQNNQLHTRPPIKTMTIEVFDTDEKPIDIVKVNNITFYKTFDGINYKYHFKYNNKWYKVNTTEKSLVYFINDTFIIFNETSIVAYQYQNGSLNLLTTNNIIYTPITKIVQGESVTEFESPNLLTTSEITRYLFEYGQTNSLQYLKLVGHTVSIVIDNVEYSFVFKQNNQLIFPKKLSVVNLNFSTDYDFARNIQSSYNGVILIDVHSQNKIYLSVDGIVFSEYSYPEDAQENLSKYSYDLRLSDDGSQVWFVQNSLITEAQDDMPNHNCYYVNIYYMNTPLVGYGGWISHKVLLYNAYAHDEETEQNELAFNVMDEKQTVSISAAYIFVNSIKTVRLHSPEANKCAIVIQINFDGVNYIGASKTWAISNIFRHIENLDAICTIVYNDGEIVCKHSEFSLDYADNNKMLSTENYAYIDSSNDMQVKYSIQNDIGLIVLFCTTKYLRYGINDSTKTGSNLQVSENGIYYCKVNLNNLSMDYCIGAIARNDTETSDNGSGMGDVNDYTPIFPCYYQKLYAYNSSANNVDYSQYAMNVPTFNKNIILFDYTADIVVKWQDAKLYIAICAKEENTVEELLCINNISVTNFQYIPNYDIAFYAYKYNYNAWSNSVTRYIYPYLFFVNIEINKIDTDNINKYYTFSEIVLEQNTTVTNFGRFAKFYNADINSINVLTCNYYFYNGEKYTLLSNASKNVTDFYPAYVSDDGQKIIYYCDANNSFYTNEFTEQIYIDYLETNGKINYIVPNFAEDFITTTIALDNFIYQAQNRFTEETGNISSHIQLYFPINSKVAFVDKITNLIVFSQTSLGIFLEDLVYEYQYNGDNDAYILTPTKMQLGCIDSADILIGYDGSTIFMTQLKGLAGLNYQDFVQSTEQVYTYLTEAIMDLYDNFKGDRKIKLYQYKDWLFMYKQDKTELYILDIRSATWWKWTNPYPIQKIVYDGNNLVLLINDQIAIYDFETNAFDDFVSTEIKWHFRSQKLHFDAPNNYKHIRQLNVITTEEGTELRYKLTFKNYRNLNNLSDTDTVLFDIDQLTTLIKRVNFVKTNAFQFEIANDETDPHPKLFETPDIVIKYRITEAVR